MSDIGLLRLSILVAGLLLIAAIYFFGRPRKSGQGRRVEEERGRIEPVLGATPESGSGPALEQGAVQSELALDAPAASAAATSELGKRREESFEKIVTLYVAARAGQVLRGPDIVVAAEKAGLVYGHMQIFHRLVDGHPDRGPVFSVANIRKPGGFDMATIQELETPAVAFFLTLPAPIPALDAWEKMLPTAQRMAELLDGVVLDESRNALGRQRIAHIREELRAWDRQHEAPPLTKPARW